MTDVDYNGLLVRVTELERQNRPWKITGLLMLLVAVFSLTANVTAQGYGSIRTDDECRGADLFTKDSAGKMTVDSDRHPVLEFYDLDGNITRSTEARAIPTK